jgi:hypothetical protein
MKNEYQCCYCKNRGTNPNDFDNVSKSSTTVKIEDESKIVVQNHIASGCVICKSFFQNHTK